MLRNPRRAVCLLLCTLGVWAGAVGATTMFREDVTALTQSSQLVVRGTVQQLESHWTADHMRIVTEIQLGVAETLKGNAGGSSVQILQAGGSVGEIGQSVVGLASFSKGEEVVVFLQQRGGRGYLVSGMAQGKYRVERSGGTVNVVPSSVGDAELVDPRTGARLLSGTQQPMTLDALRAAVRSAAQGSQP